MEINLNKQQEEEEEKQKESPVETVRVLQEGRFAWRI
jgi:predicted  nucleic acid-binding Zn-ribbon protein